MGTAVSWEDMDNLPWIARARTVGPPGLTSLVLKSSLALLRKVLCAVLASSVARVSRRPCPAGAPTRMLRGRKQ